MSLQIKNLCAGYGKTPVLQNINCTAQPGELIGLLGPNGSGKSCLLKTIAGLIIPAGGQVMLSNKDVQANKAVQDLPPRTRAKNIAWLAQDRHVAWALSVGELVALGRAPYRGRLGKYSQADMQAIKTALSAADCLDLQDRSFDSISGGEQARVLLARTLAVDAPILLADEPTASLDPYYQISILQSLSCAAKSGKTVIASLHDLTLARQFCSRVWVLQDGQLVADDKPKTALNPSLLAEVFRIQTKNGFSVQIPVKN